MSRTENGRGRCVNTTVPGLTPLLKQEGAAVMVANETADADIIPAGELHGGHLGRTIDLGDSEWVVLVSVFNGLNKTVLRISDVLNPTRYMYPDHPIHLIDVDRPTGGRP